ncbi:hypothetical protein LguiA_004955 [Lonicera macranthoides]
MSQIKKLTQIRSRSAQSASPPFTYHPLCFLPQITTSSKTLTLNNSPTTITTTTTRRS